MEPQIPPTPSYDKDINPYAKVLPPAATTTTTSTMDTASEENDKCTPLTHAPTSVVFLTLINAGLPHTCMHV